MPYPIASSQHRDLINLINGTYLDRVEQITAAEVDDQDNIIAVALDGQKKLAVKVTDNDIAIRLMGGEPAANFLKFAAPAKKPKKCSKGISCGASCIAASKTCRKKTTPTQKAQKTKIVKEAKAAPKVEVSAKVAPKAEARKSTTTIAERAAARKAAQSVDDAREARNVAARERARLARVEAANERNKNSVATLADGSKKPIAPLAPKKIATAPAKVTEDDLKVLKEELGIAKPTAKFMTANTPTQLSSRDFKDDDDYFEALYQQRRVEHELERISLDLNAGVVLPSKLGVKDSDKIQQLIKALPDGTPVIFPDDSEELAKKFGVTSRKVPLDPYSFTPVMVMTTSGVVDQGKLRDRTAAELKDIKEIRKIRAQIPQDLVNVHFNEMGDARNSDDSHLDEMFRAKPLSPRQLAAVYAKEDKLHEELDAIENRHLGRKPTGKVGDYASYEQKSAAWAKAKFGEFTEGANGFTFEQTKAHDIAHPITHELTGLDSDAIHKKFGSLKDAKGNDALYGEEAIVNVMEQLSRGSSIEASILNGVRLARNMARPDPVTGVMTASEEARAYVRSPKFVQDLAETAHKAYRHNDFAPLIGHLRKSNRISGTVTAAGDDFTNSATGG